MHRYQPSALWWVVAKLQGGGPPGLRLSRQSVLPTSHHRSCSWVLCRLMLLMPTIMAMSSGSRLACQHHNATRKHRAASSGLRRIVLPFGAQWSRICYHVVSLASRPFAKGIATFIIVSRSMLAAPVARNTAPHGGIYTELATDCGIFSSPARRFWKRAMPACLTHVNRGCAQRMCFKKHCLRSQA